MKIYEEPVINLMAFETEDILLVSGGADPGEDNSGIVGGWPASVNSTDSTD